MHMNTRRREAKVNYNLDVSAGAWGNGGLSASQVCREVALEATASGARNTNGVCGQGVKRQNTLSRSQGEGESEWVGLYNMRVEHNVLSGKVAAMVVTIAQSTFGMISLSLGNALCKANGRGSLPPSLSSRLIASSTHGFGQTRARLALGAWSEIQKSDTA